MGPLSSALAFIRRHKKKLTFAALVAALLFYLRSAYVKYVKPLRGLLQEDDFANILDEMCRGTQSSKEDKRFSKFQRISDSMALGNLYQLQQNVEALDSLDEDMQKIRDVEGTAKNELFLRIIAQCFSRCMLSVTAVSLSLLLHRFELNLIGRRDKSDNGEGVPDEDTKAFLSSTKHFQDVGIKQLHAIVDPIVQETLRKKIDSPKTVASPAELRELPTEMTNAILRMLTPERCTEILLPPPGPTQGGVVDSLLDEARDLLESPHAGAVVEHVVPKAWLTLAHALGEIREATEAARMIPMLRMQTVECFKNVSFFETDDEVRKLCLQVWNA